VTIHAFLRHALRLRNAAILTTAFNSAWEQAQTTHIPADVAVLRNLLAARIMLVASEGERDPEKLKAAPLGDIRLKPVA
jgi:hypothetical protein